MGAGNVTPGECTGQEQLSFPAPIPASQLRAADEDIRWIWKGFIEAGSITLVSALWKAGKTTLLAHLVKALGSAGLFCGKEIRRTTVLYVSEEPEQRWAERRDKLGIGDHVLFVCRPWKLQRPDHARWRAFIEHIARLVKEHEAGVVVFDTLPSLWPVVNENDASEVSTALTALNVLAELAAIVVVGHLKKFDAGEGTATRGSGGLPAFVDAIIELRRDDPKDKHCTRRVLTCYGRWDMPAEFVIELEKATNTYVGRGDKEEANLGRVKKVLLAILPRERPGFSFAGIKEAWPEGAFPRKATVLTVLAEGYDERLWVRDGAGTRNSAHTFWVPANDSVSVPEAVSGTGNRN